MPTVGTQVKCKACLDPPWFTMQMHQKCQHFMAWHFHISKYVSLKRLPVAQDNAAFSSWMTGKIRLLLLVNEMRQYIQIYYSF